MRFGFRRDVGGWSPVFIALLLLLIMILFFGLITPSTPPRAIGVAVSMSTDGTNWTLTLVSVPTGLTQNATTLNLTSAYGVTLLNATSLYALRGPGVNGVVYIPNGSGPLLNAGDQIQANVSRYPSGTRWTITNAGSILASGTLQ